MEVTILLNGGAPRHVRSGRRHTDYAENFGAPSLGISRLCVAVTPRTGTIVASLLTSAHLLHHNADVAIKSIEPRSDYAGAAKKTDPVERRLVRKLDRRILAMYFLNYLDRNTLPQARLCSLEEDLTLEGYLYNTAILVLFVDYNLIRNPSNMFLTNTKPRIYLSICMIAWAVVSACTRLVQNHQVLRGCRFLLGFVEAPYHPGAIYPLSILCTRKELAARISIMYTGQVISTGCSGLFAAAIFSTLDGAHGIAGWRYLFIIEGVISFGVAILGLLLLCNDPSETTWMTEDERTLAVARIKRDTVDVQGCTSAFTGLKEACSDLKPRLFVVVENLHISAISLNNFFPTIVNSLGFKNKITALLLTAPPYFVSGLLGIPCAWSSGHFNERTLHTTARLGLAVSMASMNTTVRYTATSLYATGAYGVGSIILGWVSAVLSQIPEKKSISYAIVNSFANLAYVYTVYTWPASNGPRYRTGFSAMIAFATTSTCCTIAMRFWLVALNKKIRRTENEHRVLFAH